MHYASSAPDIVPKIYLTAPVTGVTDTQGTWREKMRSSVEPQVRLLDPLASGMVRTPLYRIPGSTLIPSMQEFGALTIARNKEAIQSCDMLVANLLGAHVVSLGSVGEIFWADAFKKPILIVRDALGNPHDHLLLNQIATWTVFDLDGAIRQIRTFFNLSTEVS
jgi:hypothetical protein